MPFVESRKDGTKNAERRYSTAYGADTDELMLWSVHDHPDGRNRARPVTQGGTQRRGGLHVHRDGPAARSAARSEPRTTWSEPVSGPVWTVRPGTALVSAATRTPVPVQGVVPSASRVSSATTRSPGCIPGARPAQKPEAMTAASGTPPGPRRRATAASAARGPIPVRSTRTGPGTPLPLRRATCSMPRAQATSRGVTGTPDPLGSPIRPPRRRPRGRRTGHRTHSARVR